MAGLLPSASRMRIGDLMDCEGWGSEGVVVIINGRILGFNAKSDYRIDNLKYQLSSMECILNSIYKKKIINPSSPLHSLAKGLPDTDFPSSTILLAPHHITLQRSTCNKVYDLIHPVSKGVVVDWGALEEVLQHSITSNGKVDGKFVILGDSILGSEAQRNRIKETLIMKYSASDCLVTIAEEIVFFEYFIKTPVSGAVVVLFSGDCIHVTPVHEGRVLASSSVLIDFGEELLFRHFKNLWEEETSAVDSDAFVYGLFEKAAVVARDDEHRNMLSESSSEVLVPDIITVGVCRFQYAEALFRPSLVGSESPSLHSAVQDAISKSPLELQEQLYANIVISSRLDCVVNGLHERLEREVKNQTPAHFKVKVHKSPSCVM